MSPTPLSEDIVARYASTRGDARAMAVMSALLSRKALHEDAFALGLAAVEQAPHDMEVRDIVRTALAENVPDFHSAMLRDEARNRCYATAIERLVRPGMLVLDIGTGAGLLALLAARAGARVVTCESNPIVAAAAREIVARNGLADRIRVIAKPSTELAIGVDLPEPADALVSEIFGDQLFGEGVIQSLADARKRLLKPGAAVLPPRAEIRCALAARPEPRASALIGEVEGFDLAPFNLLVRALPRGVRAGNNNLLPRSAVHSALRMDFTAPPPFGPDRETIRFVSTGGRVDTVVQWLRIDFGGDIVFENDPWSGPPSHWHAPMFELVESFETEEGQAVVCEARHVGGRLTLRAIDRNSGVGAGSFPAI
jgi:type II protein arginine methyltransferase